MCEIMNPPARVIPTGEFACDSDENLTDDQIVETLAEFTSESLADEPDY